VIITEAQIPGVFAIEPERRHDTRGFFARSYCADEFAARGLSTNFPQCNISYNSVRGTLRGLHYQTTVTPEIKVVRCTSGAVFDVVVDLRKDSPSYCKWQAFELSAESRLAVYIPQGCAHGFQSLTDGAELFYMMGASYSAEHVAGVRWDDPVFSIVWPIQTPHLSAKDAAYPDYQP
jgi:dTDP-4-dehydrorhamnose 3,5-epimerase